MFRVVDMNFSVNCRTNPRKIWVPNETPSVSLTPPNLGPLDFGSPSEVRPWILLSAFLCGEYGHWWGGGIPGPKVRTERIRTSLGRSEISHSACHGASRRARGPRPSHSLLGSATSSDRNASVHNTL